jgi:two-component system sensor histidine kinase ComP
MYTGWFVLFFPVAFAYLIISKQLYDIEIVVRRAMYMIIVSVLPSLLLAGLGTLIKKEDFGQFLLTFFFTLAVMSLVLYSLEYITTRLEKIMFPRKYHLQQSLKKIAKNLSSVTNFRDMKEIILVDIVNTMQVYGGAIVFKFPHGMESIGEGAVNLEEVEKLLSQRKLQKSSNYHCFEINCHEEYTSYLVLTHKKTNTLLNREEIQWLNLIISYLSVSLENVYLIRKLNMKVHEVAAQLSGEKEWQDIVWLRKSMFELQEKERIRISNDLHDTTMQDIFFVQRKLRSIAKMLTNGEVQKQLKDVMTHLELINVNLRQCCFELNPYLIKNVGLAGALQNLFDIEAGIAPFELQYSIEGAYGIEHADLETKRHVFRVIQELINNAKKHSKATRVSFELLMNGSDFLIIYEDDGVGFKKKPEGLTQLSLSGGLGMEQMKTRILHLGGQLDIDTDKGRGVKATVTIPVKEGMTA